MSDVSFADIGTAVIPTGGIYRGNNNAFQREMFDKKQAALNKKQSADRLDKEAKNWELPYDKIDPIYHNEAKKTFANFSANIVDRIKDDPRFANSPEYYQALNELNSKVGNWVQSTAAKKQRDQMLLTHPDAVVVDDPAKEEALQKGDHETFTNLNGGDDRITTGYNLKPNIDLSKAFEDGAKFSATGVNEEVIPYKDGYSKKVTTKNYSPDLAAQYITNLQHSNAAAAAMPDLAHQFKDYLDKTRRSEDVVKDRLPAKDKTNSEPSFEQLSKQGLIHDNVPIALNDQALKGTSSERKGGGKLRYVMAVKTAGNTNIVNDGTIIDRGTERPLKSAGQITVSDIGNVFFYKDNKTKKYVPAASGVATTKVMDANGVEHIKTNNVIVPLRLVDNFITATKGNNIGWVADKERELNSGSDAQPAKAATQESYSNVTKVKDAKGNTISIGVKNGKWFDTATGKAVE